MKGLEKYAGPRETEWMKETDLKCRFNLAALSVFKLQSVNTLMKEASIKSILIILMQKESNNRKDRKK